MRDIDTEPAIISLQADRSHRAGSASQQAPAVANLALTVTNPPTQAEVQAISNKVDELLAALRAGGGLAQ